MSEERIESEKAKDQEARRKEIERSLIARGITNLARNIIEPGEVAAARGTWCFGEVDILTKILPDLPKFRWKRIKKDKNEKKDLVEFKDIYMTEFLKYVFSKAQKIDPDLYLSLPAIQKLVEARIIDKEALEESGKKDSVKAVISRRISSVRQSFAREGLPRFLVTHTAVGFRLTSSPIEVIFEHLKNYKRGLDLINGSAAKLRRSGAFRAEREIYGQLCNAMAALSAAATEWDLFQDRFIRKKYWDIIEHIETRLNPITFADEAVENTDSENPEKDKNFIYKDFIADDIDDLDDYH